jgi:PhzF family phenazine biosynthesis protein
MSFGETSRYSVPGGKPSPTLRTVALGRGHFSRIGTLHSSARPRQGGHMTSHSPALAAPVLRYAAFAASASGGNPAGIVMDATGLDDSTMQHIAAEVGYAETAFVIETSVDGDPHRSRVRYFSPQAEVPFCGHATVATAVALAERSGPGRYVFDTAVGEVVLVTEQTEHGIRAAFTSVEPEVRALEPATLGTLLALLGLTDADLDDRYPVRVAYAGNWHPILVLRDLTTFDGFRFDPAALRTLMDMQGWKGTVTVLHAQSSTEFEARNLFPVGTITEDPATGSAAASLGGYLRDLGLGEFDQSAAPARVIVHQGRHVGRPSLLTSDIPPVGGMVVSGTAAPIE